MDGYRIFDWEKYQYKYVSEEDYKESRFTEIVNEAKMNRDGVWNDSSKPLEDSVFNLKVGQEVYYKASWSSSWVETKIKTVGSKYITVESHNIKFYKDTFIEAGTVYGAPLVLILDTKKNNEVIELRKAKAKMKYVNWGIVNIEDFDKIQRILNKYSEDIYSDQCR